MDAKHIAQLIATSAELRIAGEIDHETQANLTAGLWELATRKDLREEVDAILQANVLQMIGA